MIRARPHASLLPRRPSGQPDYYTTYPRVCQEVFEKFFNFFAVFFAALLAVSLHIIALLSPFVNRFFQSFFNLEIQASLYKCGALVLCNLTNDPAYVNRTAAVPLLIWPIYASSGVLFGVRIEISSNFVSNPFTISQKYGIL